MAHGRAWGMPITTNFIVTTVYKSNTIDTTRLQAYTSKDLPPLKISGENPDTRIGDEANAQQC